MLNGLLTLQRILPCDLLHLKGSGFSLEDILASFPARLLTPFFLLPSVFFTLLVLFVKTNSRDVEMFRQQNAASGTTPCSVYMRVSRSVEGFVAG